MSNDWRRTELAIAAVEKALKEDYEAALAAGHRLNPLTVPLLHPKKKRKGPKGIHSFHKFMAEVRECQARPEPKKITRRFTFDQQ